MAQVRDTRLPERTFAKLSKKKVDDREEAEGLVGDAPNAETRKHYKPKYRRRRRGRICEGMAERWNSLKLEKSPARWLSQTASRATQNGRDESEMPSCTYTYPRASSKEGDTPHEGQALKNKRCNSSRSSSTVGMGKCIFHSDRVQCSVIGAEPPCAIFLANQQHWCRVLLDNTIL